MRREKSPIEKPKDKRRYMEVPEPLYNEVNRIAKERGVTTVSILRQSIKLGLLVASSSPDTEFIVRDTKHGREKLLVFL